MVFSLRIAHLCFILSIVGIPLGMAQTYRDNILAFREAKAANFAEDPGAPLSAADTGYLHYYDPDSTYRVQATVELLINEQPFRIPTSDGTSKEYVRYAKARFRFHGEPVELTLYRSVALFADSAYRNHLFLPFTDGTNGEETYGGGRYIDLSTADIRNGQLVIDFNDAYNPYCAYSSGYRCPVPPAENNLSIAIRAGERRYTGPLKERPSNP
ncbi:DUF1684 domain-containing protein [Parapedobacter sp. DT-150]|uniref:DUF1684 domain-containing protein n=1 Tax=Parapedobacter sp. DT-150 TaxID=3396162 RepID=UPI003F1B5918